MGVPPGVMDVARGLVQAWAAASTTTAWRSRCHRRLRRPPRLCSRRAGNDIVAIAFVAIAALWLASRRPPPPRPPPPPPRPFPVDVLVVASSFSRRPR